MAFSDSQCESLIEFIYLAAGGCLLFPSTSPSIRITVPSHKVPSPSTSVLSQNTGLICSSIHDFGCPQYSQQKINQFHIVYFCLPSNLFPALWNAPYNAGIINQKQINIFTVIELQEGKNQKTVNRHRMGKTPGCLCSMLRAVSTIMLLLLYIAHCVPVYSLDLFPNFSTLQSEQKEGNGRSGTGQCILTGNHMIKECCKCCKCRYQL